MREAAGHAPSNAASRPWGAIVVLCTFALALAQLVAFVFAYASPIPLADDLTIVDVSCDGLSWAWLWDPINEHRNPVAKLVQYALFAATGDLRSGMYAVVCVLALGALATIETVRRLRGHLIWTDAALVLVWMQIGSYENLLMGFTLSFVIPMLLVWLVASAVLVNGEGLSATTATLVGLGLVSLAWCGGPGFLQAQVLAVWLAWTAVQLRKQGDARARRSGTILLVSVAVCAVAEVLYVRGLGTSSAEFHTLDLRRILGVGVRDLSLVFGPAAEIWWPYSGIAVLGFAVGAGWLYLQRLRRAGEHKLEASALLVLIAAGLLLAIGIGFGRGGVPGPLGFPIRYVGLAAPLVCASAMAWDGAASATLRKVAAIALLVATVLASVWLNPPISATFGRARHAACEDFVEALRPTGSPDHLTPSAANWFEPNWPRLREQVRRMAAGHVAPFDRPGIPVLPSEREIYGVALSAREGRFRPGHDPSVELAEAASKLYIDVPPGMRRMRGEFAAVFDPEDHSPTAALRFMITHRPDASPDPAPTAILFDRTLHPESSASDRGLVMFEVEIPAGPPGRVALRIVRAIQGETPTSLGTWRALRFEP